jgi:2-C-methyl-D-erythritol 4-phosphate cytidylyltransferase
VKTRKNLAVIVAAGSGKRMIAEKPKQFLEIGGKPVLAMTIECFDKASVVDEIVLVVAEEYLAYVSQSIVDRFGFEKIVKIIAGGKTRQESVLAGLTACPTTTATVAIHDGVRPFIKSSLIEKLFDSVKATGAAIPAVLAKETIKIVKKNLIVSTLPREQGYLAQTPQVFDYAGILKFHKKAAREKFVATDDSMLAERYSMKVMIVPGYYDNIKITTPEDLILAKEIVRRW